MINIPMDSDGFTEFMDQFMDICGYWHDGLWFPGFSIVDEWIDGLMIDGLYSGCIPRW